MPIYRLQHGRRREHGVDDSSRSIPPGNDSKKKKKKEDEMLGQVGIKHAAPRRHRRTYPLRQPSNPLRLTCPDTDNDSAPCSVCLCRSTSLRACLPSTHNTNKLKFGTTRGKRKRTFLFFFFSCPLVLGTSRDAPRSASAQPVPRPVRLAFSSTEDASSSVPARTSPSAATPPPRSDPLPARPDRGRRDGAVSDAALHTFIRRTFASSPRPGPDSDAR